MRVFFMRHISGDSRQQATLLPDTLDDYVDEGRPVRVIDAFVDTLFGCLFYGPLLEIIDRFMLRLQSSRLQTYDRLQQPELVMSRMSC